MHSCPSQQTLIGLLMLGMIFQLGMRECGCLEHNAWTVSLQQPTHDAETHEQSVSEAHSHSAPHSHPEHEPHHLCSQPVNLGLLPVEMAKPVLLTEWVGAQFFASHVSHTNASLFSPEQNAFPDWLSTEAAFRPQVQVYRL